MSYSPQLRTAVLLSGSGTDGAYHAGVLRALHEAGIKIDVASGRGIGIVGALFTAIDAAPKTWEEGGVWRRRTPIRLYRWKPAMQTAGTLCVLAAAILLVPLFVIATGLVVYPLSFLVQMISVDTGHRMATTYSGMIASAFSERGLPTIVPRLITLLVSVAFGVLAVAALRARTHPRMGQGHRDLGPWWARLLSSPWSAEPGLDHFLTSLWELFRGPSSGRPPASSELSRRYTELLLENLGQPGFKELIVSTVDLETRNDLVFAALAESRRHAFFHRRQGDVVDLSGVGRTQALDALAGGLSIALLTEPHRVVFPPESYWKGETHRTCDRPAAVDRLLQELNLAGVDQVILVSADAERSAPHRLTTPGSSLQSRLGEHLAADETAAIRDAVVAHRKMFKGIFTIQPMHNPIGTFDFGGAYDPRSDRYQSLGELSDRGYEDAYRQFLEPVVAKD